MNTVLMFSSRGATGPSLRTESGVAGAQVAAASALWRVADGGKKGRPAVADPSPGELAVRRLLAGDASYAAKVKRVRRFQAQLRRQLSAPAWQAYLRLEEAELERWSYAFDRMARWAVARRSQRR